MSGSARALSGGDLSADVEYVGRDEIGDVAEAFRDLHVTSERLAAEIRAMNEAITRNRLDHRADVAALEGTWSQLLGGMNETMAAFADLQGRRRDAVLELERVFTMSVDLLCIAGFDGYLKRVNPAWCVPSATRSRSCCRDRSSSSSTPRTARRPTRRCAYWPPARSSWSSRTATSVATGRRAGSHGPRARSPGAPIYGVARDVTDRKRREAEEAALRRVATLVARTAAPTEVFDAVAREVGLLCDADIARLERFERSGTVTVVAALESEGRGPAGGRHPLCAERDERRGTGGEDRPARAVDTFEGARAHRT